MARKLSPAQVQEIRSAPIGTRIVDLARKYGVRPPSITRIRKGEQGKQVPVVGTEREVVERGRNVVETLANSLEAGAEIIRRTMEDLLNQPDATARARVLGVVTRAHAEMTGSLANLKHPATISWMSSAEKAEILRQMAEKAKEGEQ